MRRQYQQKNSRFHSVNCDNHAPHVIYSTRDSAHVALPASAIAATDICVYTRIDIRFFTGWLKYFTAEQSDLMYYSDLYCVLLLVLHALLVRRTSETHSVSIGWEISLKYSCLFIRAIVAYNVTIKAPRSPAVIAYSRVPEYLNISVPINK